MTDEIYTTPSESTPTSTATATVPPADQTDQTDQADQADQPLVADDLVEEVSIDGMCGVY